MHLGTAALLDFHARHRDEDSLVLATITHTRGSTYRKPGAMMLIAPNGDYEGLISGGCLEGDLLQHASQVTETGVPARVVYDMHSDDDLVWGLGIGCDGVIELSLIQLEQPQHQELFGFIRQSLQRRQRVLFCLTIDANNEPPPLGTLAAADESGARIGDERLCAIAENQASDGWPDWRFRHVGSGSSTVMLINLIPQPRILLCGGGADAVPVAAQCAALGWQCAVVDHRPAYAKPGRFPASTTVTLCRPANLADTVDLTEFDGAVIMSHHLESDAAYLGHLAPLADSGSLRYLGVLGPTARRKRLRDMAGCPEVLIHGPVGLDIGAELPESIALAVAAEIHAVFNGRDGQSLTTGPVGDGA